jgi:hypothetical protein
LSLSALLFFFFFFYSILEPTTLLLSLPPISVPFLSFLFDLVPSLAAAAKMEESQVAHGLILRCFVKRWLGLAVDFPLQMMLSPGAIAVLRYVGI